MLDLASLNENQLKAVQWTDGSLLVLAGPGSGKTRVLTYRIARLIEESPKKYFKVLALTFTNKAAAEMRERIQDLIPNNSQRALLTTFHSFCADLLRQHGSHVGLRPDFTILVEDSDRQSLLEEAIERNMQSTDAAVSSERLLPLIGRLTENDVTPDEAEAVLQANHFEDPASLALIYGEYRRLMIERNTLDFAGLISEAHGLLQSRVGVRKQIQRVYPYICVDEFQDTNLAQYKILRQLVNADTKNLFVVADDDQIIYQWNGASPERLWALRQDFGMELLQLPQNYRCPAPVVELANQLIAHNFERSTEKSRLTAHKSVAAESAVRLEHFHDFAEEARWVAADIAARPKAAQQKTVVLARTKKLLEDVIDALTDAGVPAYIAIRKNEFESASLQWMHSVLRLANARSSREHLRRLCKAFFALEGLDLNVKDIMSLAGTLDGDYLRAWASMALARSGLSKATRRLLETSLPKLSERLDFWGFQADAFSWLDSLPDEAPDVAGTFEEYESERATWRELVAEISAQYGRDQITLHLLLQELDLRSKAPSPPPGAVPCFTIHASKGMEFDHVYLVGLVEDQLPSWAAKKKGDDSREMQEERRNCFVAITRAQETLTLTYSSRVGGWAKQPSRFLAEMGLAT
jgi:DNA helicase-2/ATP-dependent DNA helicase PcrA